MCRREPLPPARVQRLFREAVVSSGGIYHHRWGDALLRRLSVELHGLLTCPLPAGYTASDRHGCQNCQLQPRVMRRSANVTV